jgi:arsenate reductase (thioredoxin)
MKSRILILCTGNSCRSQMADGIVNHFLGEQYIAFSAGSKPSIVHPVAIEVMKEIGIDLSNNRSKHVDEYQNESFDLIVTVCDNAKETCPIYLGDVKKEHWSFEDPADAAGTDEEIKNEFRRIRDQIKKTFIEKLSK